MQSTSPVSGNVQRTTSTDDVREQIEDWLIRLSEIDLALEDWVKQVDDTKIYFIDTLKENIHSNLVEINPPVQTDESRNTAIYNFAYQLICKTILKDYLPFALTLAESFRDEGHRDQELFILEVIKQSFSDFYWPYYAIGRKLFEEAAYQRALEQLRLADQLQNDNGWPALLAARCCVQLRMQDEALGFFEKAAEQLQEKSIEISVSQLSLLPHHTWDQRHGKVIKRIIGNGPIDDTTADTLVDFILRFITINQHSTPNASENIQKLLSDIEECPAFFRNIRFLPVCISLAFSFFASATDTARRYLQKFERQLPGASSELPPIILSRITDVIRSFVIYIYIEDTQLNDVQKAFCKDISLICSITLGLSDFARLISSIALSRHTDNTSDLSTQLTIFRNQKFWFEVIQVCKSLDLTQSVSDNQYLVECYCEALLEVSKGNPWFCLIAIRRSLSVISESENHAFLFDLFRGRLNKLLGMCADDLHAICKQIGLSGDLNGSVNIWHKLLFTICETIERIEDVKFVSPGDRLITDKGPVIILTSPYLPQVKYYRALQLQSLLDHAGIVSEVIDLTECHIDDLELKALKASAVVFQRQPATLRNVRFARWCKNIGVKTFFDIDDQIFDMRIFPLPFSDYSFRIDGATHCHLALDTAYFFEMLNRCDTVLVSTTTLMEQVQSVLRAPKHVVVRRNILGKDVEILALEQAGSGEASQISTKSVHIFYGSATKAHKEYFDIVVLPAIEKILIEYQYVYLHLVGEFDSETLPESVRGKVTVTK